MSNNTVSTKSEAFREQERFADKGQEKEWQHYTRNFLPRFSSQTRVRIGTNREFFEICRLSGDVFEDVVKQQPQNIKKVDWVCVGRWNRRWRRRYPNYWDFLKSASRNLLKN